MGKSIINKKMVRSNKAMKHAVKNAKKYYGRVRGKAPKAKIGKVVDITDISYMDLMEQTSQSNEVMEMETEVFLNLLESKNLTGRSGNGYQTVIKLRTYLEEFAGKGTLIVNGVECDPGLVHDGWIYRNKLQQVEKGIELLQRYLNFQRIYLATREKTDDNETAFTQIRIPNRFPCGYEKEVVRFILGMELEDGEYPLDKGILVLNIQTVLAIASIMTGRANDWRYITVASILEARATVVRTKLGKNVKEVAKAAYPDASGHIYMGGGALNCQEMKEDSVIDQTTNIIAFGEMPAYESAGNCKGCGGCSSKCPQKIKVHKIVQALEKGQVPQSEEAKRCIGCGACTYGCPQGKDVRDIITSIKIGNNTSAEVV